MQTTLAYRVLNHTDREVYRGTHSQCRAWIRKHNSGFFCRVEAMSGAIQTPVMVRDQPERKTFDVRFI